VSYKCGWLIPANERAAAAAFLKISPTLLEMRKLEVDTDLPRDAWDDAITVALYFMDLAESSPLSIELNEFRDLLESMCSIPGVDWLQSWIQIGIIETIQNSLANRFSRNNQSLSPKDFYGSLGPMSQKAWRAVDKMWGTSINDIDE